MSSTIVNLPFRTLRNSQGVVTIEKHYSDMSPNCGIGVLLVIIAIVLPASLVAVAPVASILLLIGSTLFPGIPLFLINKKWRVDIDNTNRQLKVTRWHEFNKLKKQEDLIKFDEIREIVAETSLDGTKRRLVAIMLTGTRHVLYETMNMVHADRFKNDFMGAIQLQSSQIPRQSSFVSPIQQVTPSLQPTSQSSNPSNSIAVVPSLRQFSIPDPDAWPGSSSSKPDVLPASPTQSSWGVNDDVDDVDDASSPPDTSKDLPASTPSEAVVSGNQETVNAPQEDEAAIHQRLVEIARRKREILARVYRPGTEPEQDPPVAASSTNQAQANADAVCIPLRNRDDKFNEFSNCEGIAYLFSPELGGRRPEGSPLASGLIETRSGRAPKKKAGDDDEEDEVITHEVDWRIERQLKVQRVRPTCMVCTIPLKGTTFICPTCETKYCIRCARALAGRKEYCWTCRKPLKVP